MGTLNTFDAKIIAEIRDEGGVAEYLFKTPAGTTDVEAFSILYGDADFTCEMWEGVTTSNDGTLLSDIVINTNRESTDTPELLLYTTPTVTNYGKKIWFTRVTADKSATGIWENYSILPKSNVKYVWKLIKNSVGGRTNFIEIDFWWKEAKGTLQ